MLKSLLATCFKEILSLFIMETLDAIKNNRLK